MRIDRVTITGADDNVRHYDLAKIADEFKFVEWGILISRNKEGREARYPSRQWIDRLFARTSPIMATSGHLCGRWSREVATGPLTWGLVRNRQFNSFGRLQFNGVDEIDRLALANLATISNCCVKDVIVQCKNFDAPNRHGREEPLRLLDLSGGRGIRLEHFPAPTAPYCGYAGGFGPDNLEGVLIALAGMPGEECWVDMESGVRTGDDFDLDKVRRCLEIAAPFIKE